MMLQPTEEEAKLYDELKKTNDPEKIKRIRARLYEIALQEEEELKDCPFVH